LYQGQLVLENLFHHCAHVLQCLLHSTSWNHRLCTSQNCTLENHW
jgi:hypothetical protein